MPGNAVADVDPHFYDRADALIELANAQLAGAPRAPVGDAFLYAASRFNAWSAACEQGSAQALAGARDQLLEAFVGRYRDMLQAQLDDYIAYYAHYLPARQPPR